MSKEEKKDEIKNKISMALKDPILQQCFEIICKNLTVLEQQIADIKANCDLAIEGRDIKIKELEQELTVEKDQHQEEVELHLHAEEYIKSLEQQIEKMRNCGNCKYGYCGGSSISIDKDGNRTFHNWNEEKQAYCDIGKNGKYQCWEIKEND